MASLLTLKNKQGEPNGRWAVQFVDADGQRKTVRVGKMNQKQAEAVQRHIEQLVSKSISGHAVPDTTAVWLNGIGDELHGKLEAVGLVTSRNKNCDALGPFIDDYIASRSNLKDRTIHLLKETRDSLIDRFGAEMTIQEFSDGDAEDFRQYLLGRGLAENTTRRRCGRASQFFRYAVKKRLIASNPFDDITKSVGTNKARYYFVKREDAEKVLEACPNADWRILFALARYGGLRSPSETLTLQWCDVDWDNERILVRSPKTEHHEGKESRLIPMFPELKPHLEAAFDDAPVGAKFVVQRYRDQDANLRTHLQRIIQKAGVKPWPKLWQNLRATRETELVKDFPIHVACEWIGNSVAVASKHYLQVTEDHYEQALRKALQQETTTGHIAALS